MQGVLNCYENLPVKVHETVSFPFLLLIPISFYRVFKNFCCLQDEFEHRLTKAVKLAKSEWQETAKRDTEKTVERAMEEYNRKNQTSKQMEVEQAVINAKESWEKDARRMKDIISGVNSDMENLKKENEHFKTEVNRVRNEAEKKEVEFMDRCKEIEERREIDIEFAVTSAKVNNCFIILFNNRSSSYLYTILC